MLRKTIKTEVELTGIGLHKGKQISLILKPNDDNSSYGRGIYFKRVDITDKNNVIKLDYRNLFDLERGTNLKNEDNVEVYTIEHFLSSLANCGITDIIVEINGNELPILDGSALKFLEKLEEAGIKELLSNIDPIEIKETITFVDEEKGRYIVAMPNNEFKISYTIDFSHPYLQSQYFDIIVDKKNYEKEIAMCRTFAFDYEIEFLKKNNLALGGSLENAIVVGENGPLNEGGLRIEKEFVRHKILDMIGDLYVLGRPIKGHFIAVKSGHFINSQITKKIAENNGL